MIILCTLFVNNYQVNALLLFLLFELE